MEEDNKVIQEIKNTAKKVLKKKSTFIVTVVVLSIIAIIVFLAASTYFITIDDGTYKDDDWSNTQYAVSEKVTSKVSQENIAKTSDGYSYGLDIDEVVKDIIQTLDDENGNLDDYLSFGNREKYLKAFIKAELVTQYPDLRSKSKVGTEVAENDFQGCIQVRRAGSSAENGETTIIDYVPKETFDAYIKEANREALKHFTMDKEGNIVVAGWNEVTTTVKSNEEGVENKTTTQFELTTNSINYRQMLQNYTMPFDFLWALLVMGEDEDFVYDVAQLVLDSKIVVEVQDNLTVTLSKDVKEYQLKSMKSRYLHYDVTMDGVKYSKDEDVGFGEEETETFTTITTTLSKSNSTNLDIVEADTWIVKYTNKYTNEVPDNPNPTIPEDAEPDSVVTEPDEDYKLIKAGEKLPSNDEVANIMLQIYLNEIGASNATKPDDYKAPEVTASVSGTYNLYERKVGQKISYYSATASNTYIKGTPVIEEKTDKNAVENNFVKLFANAKLGTRNKILTAQGTWLFEILESNDSTKQMLDLVKYLLYKATGDDYGVTEYDFSIYDITKFSSMTAGNALWEFIKAWEGCGEMSPDGTKYKIVLVPTDWGEKNRTVGYGVDLETSGAEIKFKAAGYSTNPGDYVDVDFVDSISLEELASKRERVISQTADCQPPLSNQQIDALTAIMYQYGNIGNFVEMYNKYGNTDQLRENVTNASGIYHYFIKGPEDNGRPDANWKLFHEGIYTDQNGNEIVVSGVEGSTDLGGVTVATYTSSFGRTYRQYKQNVGSWASAPYAGGTIGQVGCSITSVAIVSTGYGYDYLPSKWAGGLKSIISITKSFAPNSVQVNSTNKADIQNHLKTGEPVIVQILEGNKYVASGGGTHFVALLDIDNTGENVYVSNPNSTGPNGWDTLDNVLRNLKYYIKVKK